MKLIPIFLIALLGPSLAAGQTPAQYYQNQMANERRRAEEAAQRYRNQQANERQRAEEAAQRYRNQQANERRMAEEAAQRYRNQQANERARAAEAAERYRVQREVQQANDRQRAAEATQRYQMQREMSQPSYSVVSPAPRASSPTTVGREQATPLDSGTIAINGVRVPKGATHYLVQGNNVRYFGNQAAPAPAAPVATVPVAPTAEVVDISQPPLPSESFAPLYDNFASNDEAGVYASILLLDEPIGPLSLDKPVFEAPELSEALAKEIAKDRFSTVKASFDNASPPNVADLHAKSGWSGRCISRQAPTTEVSAVLGFSDDGAEKKVTLFVGNSANPVGIRPLVESSEREWKSLSDEAKKSRGFVRDSLFFDFPAPSFPEIPRLGYRMRKILGAQGKELVVLEGYSPIREDVAIAGKRVSHLEPLQYCYFTRYEQW